LGGQTAAESSTVIAQQQHSTTQQHQRCDRSGGLRLTGALLSLPHPLFPPSTLWPGTGAKDNRNANSDAPRPAWEIGSARDLQPLLQSPSSSPIARLCNNTGLHRDAPWGLAISPCSLDRPIFEESAGSTTPFPLPTDRQLRPPLEDGMARHGGHGMARQDAAMRRSERCLSTCLFFAAEQLW
jgi:hypothetical protein